MTKNKGVKMEKYKTGDVVQLKSGGPKMTVKSSNVSGEIYCQWFAGSKLEAGYFPPESLNRVKENEGKKE